jgi:hypothetical protein
VSTGYSETLSLHLASSLQFGIAVHLVLWGNPSWTAALAAPSIFNLAERYVAACRATHAQTGSMLSESIVVASSGTFDTSTRRFNASVNSLQLGPTDNASLLQRLTSPLGGAVASSNVSWVRLTTIVGDCECSATFFVPPSFAGECSMDTHAYLRDTSDDLLLAANALTMFVVHTGGQDGPDDHALETLAAQRRRLCAPIPNTKAARYLLSFMSSAREGAGRTPATGVTSERESTDILQELRALEAEHVSLRAAYMELVSRPAVTKTGERSPQAAGRELALATSSEPLHIQPQQQTAVLQSLLAVVHSLLGALGTIPAICQFPHHLPWMILPEC